MGGIMSVTGQPDGSPGAGPVKCGVAFADIFTGLYSTIAVLAALRHRDATGEGQHIDMALLDCQVGVLANQALNYFVGGTPPPRSGNAHPNLVPYQTFETSNGHVVIAVGNERQFRSLCELAGLPELPDDPRFASSRARVTNRKVLIPILEEAVRRRSSEEWIADLEAATVPCGPINRIDEVFALEQVKTRGMQLGLTRPDGTRTPGLASPIKLSATPVEATRAAPALGADTDAVLGRLLGLNAASIEALRASGAIARPAP
jgi:crotonobetainyl-CoA:carnitine CoA-transferase CaiB-like acyl-CoA transferase